MLSGRVGSQVILRVILISVLCFVSGTGMENHTSILESILGDESREFSLGHYLSLLPGGINLDDISSGRLYAYGDLPPDNIDETSISVQPTVKKIKKKTPQNEAVFHKCKYCMQRRVNQNKHVQKKGPPARRIPQARRTPIKLPPIYMTKGTLSWPIDSGQFWISCYFGRKSRGRLHKGLDLAAMEGTPVKVAARGVVEMAINAGTFGNMVLIRHKNGLKTRYAHLQSVTVFPGQSIPRGKLIGYVGNTGRVTGRTGHHLHFEVLIGKTAINPKRFLA